jgi:aldehyde dehydrogenase (NAD+)
VVNVVTGDGETGAALVELPDIDKIAFTGSTEVGRSIREATAGSGKRLSLELGGKSPFVVFEDADLDSVVEGVVDAIWFNQGQVCCAGSRILVQEGVAEALESKLRARMETLRMGDPLDKSVDMGAIVAPVQLERIRDLVEKGREEGATVWQPSWSAPEEGWFYPPTLCTDVQPAGTLARVEIFGPVVALLTFRTPDEAVALANDTRYGLAASVWSEDVNVALDVAPRIKAGTVWINCTNLFDAASGFGGYRESGFGREGGREGLWEYVTTLGPDEVEVGEAGPAPRAVPAEEMAPGGAAGEALRTDAAAPVSAAPDATHPGDGSEEVREGGDGGSAPPSLAPLDRTAKLYIGGRQTRPDADASLVVLDAAGEPAGEVGRGGRKDVRTAVEAARKAQPTWAGRTAHNRAQILYYLAENLEARTGELVARLTRLSSGESAVRHGEPAGPDADAAVREVAATVRRLFTWAAWSDKWEGRVHATPFRNVTLAMPEPIGVMGAVCPEEHPLLGLISCVAPLMAVGNTVVAVPSEGGALLAADLYPLLETSDVPGGVVNLVTGLRREVVPTLAAHDGVDGIWYFGPDPEESAAVERASAGNLKRSWVSHGLLRDWLDPARGESEELLREATHVKNIWVPYGA